MRQREIRVGTLPYGTRTAGSIESLALAPASAETIRLLRFVCSARDWEIRMPATQSDAAVRHDLMEQLADARQRTDDLFAVVKPDFLCDRPISQRHRIIFYIGHLEAFDWNLFHERVFGLKS